MKGPHSIVGNWDPTIRRICLRCGSAAKVEIVVGGKYQMKCANGHRFIASPGRLETWVGRRDTMIDYFQRRKQWARDLLAANGLKQPGDSLLGEFEGARYEVKIGPRQGVRIREL
ncbi:hypothetical protein A2303_05690 [Candidatus Falkowbacteria bacterium RIFOXYB2_FULL_47_14]|uniref:Uncharacterized protein n=1 Tax=Candidatus Falkowbacteria bacterium RIFOXYA2_FULL_47_19 TaxID=1797994 RepID=A0A1F5SEQ8_9BACT|nr:MAG: hypothetical protein A2227_07090 [Candidatus Falkowbacteria bacterium RIFOXYA2_FULL_47_19]OGF35336.1 MAG: hypothetical protein A2468_00240 [Candidatus Falkowbacteria bacterium RIFOXYC2_FULL_46_15]OGF43778.1 MAG: hypothetical protein A2303_05690 [Candidatus Falkowbacteria bacterium RIFOXYB2_FULL_47_14]